jgi:type III restriction enzyme
LDDRFFEQPILNSPYDYPARHWELDEQGQPTHQIVERRRSAEFITPIPKPRRRRASAQQHLILDDGLSTQQQQYDPTRSSTPCASGWMPGASCPTRATGA